MQATGKCHDVLIVGAGLSGIGTAVHILRDCPWADVALVEMRKELGGTWSLFRYPGVRSDSDMFTLGYDFKPWTGANSIAAGTEILAYLRETAIEYNVLPRISYGKRVVRAHWSKEEAQWSVEIQCADTNTLSLRKCRFLFMAAGYFSYKGGHRPDFPGEQDFTGQILHPQAWPHEFDWANKRVAVIGSGATAITLVPALATLAKRVSMIQRSPTYIAAVPLRAKLANVVRHLLPPRVAYAFMRACNIAFNYFFYQVSRTFPKFMARVLLAGVRNQLPSTNVERDWTPSYRPWDERLCAVPDGDLFEAIRNGHAEVVTGKIDHFFAEGIRMADGRMVPADVVITATGLTLNFLGDIDLSVNGQPIKGEQRIIYKGCMLDGVPNLAYAFGYTNASWTLKIDLTARWLARLLNYMHKHCFQVVTPVRAPGIDVEQAIALKSEYIQRAASILPKQGKKRPWRSHDNYILDWWELTKLALHDDVLQFKKASMFDASSGEANGT